MYCSNNDPLIIKKPYVDAMKQQRSFVCIQVFHRIYRRPTPRIMHQWTSTRRSLVFFTLEVLSHVANNCCCYQSSLSVLFPQGYGNHSSHNHETLYCYLACGDIDIKDTCSFCCRSFFWKRKCII